MAAKSRMFICQDLVLLRTTVSFPTVCQEAALTRRIAWRRSGGRVGLGLSGKQLHPATPELTAWQEKPADSSQ